MGRDEEAAAEVNPLNEGLLAAGTRIVYLGGVLPNEDLVQFRRMMTRVTRGKVLVRSTRLEIPFEDSFLKEPDYGKDKAVFILAFEEGDYIMDRVKRIANSFKSGETFEINTTTVFGDLNMAVAGREDCQRVIRQSRGILREYLAEINSLENLPSVFKIYQLFVNREMMVHQHMNMLKRSELVSQALVWVPRESEFEK